MNIAIIPARGGSKRIKNKNIKIFYGKPIIYWSIIKLMKTRLFSKIYVSTDSKIIKQTLGSLDCEILFPRPKYLSNNYATTISVIQYEINKIKDRSIKNICCMYPTSPLTSVKDILRGYNLLKKNRKSFIIPSCKAGFDIERVFYKNKKFILKNAKFINSRSQDLRTFYHDAGQFYWATKNKWLKSKNLFDGFLPFEINQSRFCDINNIEDWKRAEILFNGLKKLDDSLL